MFLTFGTILLILLAHASEIHTLSLTKWWPLSQNFTVSDKTRPQNVLFDPLPERNRQNHKFENYCGGTILSDSAPRLRIVSGEGLNGTDKTYIEQSITFKHTRGETLCFKTAVKRDGVLYKTNHVEIHVPSQYGDVHRRHVRLSSRRAAKVTATMDTYRHPDTMEAQRARVLEHLQHNHPNDHNERHLIRGFTLRRENQYAREDWCTFYYWWNRCREYVHLIELDGPVISDITYMVDVKASNATILRSERIIASTVGQANDPGHLGIKDLKVILPHHPLKSQNHYVVPSSLPDIQPTIDANLGGWQNYNRTVPIFYGDRGVNRPDEFSADKAFFLDDPYQYSLFDQHQRLDQLVQGAAELGSDAPNTVPRGIASLPLHFDKGRLSGLVWDPFPHFRAYMGQVGDSDISKLAKVPKEMRYNLDLGFPYISGLRNEDEYGQLILQTTFSLLEEVVSTEVVSGAIAVLNCTQNVHVSFIQNDTHLVCHASDIIAEGPLRFNLYTSDGQSLWQQHLMIHGTKSGINFTVPLFILGNGRTVHVCSTHGVCSRVENAGRPSDMTMVHLNTPGTKTDGIKDADETRNLKTILETFWQNVKQFFVNIWQWVRSHFSWTTIILFIVGSVVMMIIVYKCISCCKK